MNQPTFEWMHPEDGTPSFMKMFIKGRAYYIDATLSPQRDKTWWVGGFWYTNGGTGVSHVMKLFTAESEEEAVNTAVGIIQNHNRDFIIGGFNELQNLLEGTPHVV